MKAKWAAQEPWSSAPMQNVNILWCFTWKKKSKKCKQTLASVWYELEIIFKCTFTIDYRPAMRAESLWWHDNFTIGHHKLSARIPGLWFGHHRPAMHVESLWWHDCIITLRYNLPQFLDKWIQAIFATISYTIKDQCYHYHSLSSDVTIFSSHTNLWKSCRYLNSINCHHCNSVTC